jgi:hypothetical protein
MPASTRNLSLVGRQLSAEARSAAIRSSPGARDDEVLDPVIGTRDPDIAAQGEPPPGPPEAGGRRRGAGDDGFFQR